MATRYSIKTPKLNNLQSALVALDKVRQKKVTNLARAKRAINNGYGTVGVDYATGQVRTTRTTREYIIPKNFGKKEFDRWEVKLDPSTMSYKDINGNEYGKEAYREKFMAELMKQKYDEQFRAEYQVSPFKSDGKIPPNTGISY